jgi:hypothetical protein
VTLAFVMCAGAVYLLSYATVPATAYLMLFVLGAADGTTEVVHDTLMQLNVERSLRAGLFAFADSIKTLGMVAGLASAPLVERAMSTAGGLRLSALGCLVGAGFGLLVLVSRDRGEVTDDLLRAPGPAPAALPPLEQPAEPPALDDRVPAFAVMPPTGGDLVPLSRLVKDGPVVLALLASDEPTTEQLSMLQDLADRGARAVAVVSSDRAVPRGHAASGIRWLVDPGAGAFRSFGLTGTDGLLRSGAFIVDEQQVLRLAYAQPDEGGWLPASVVRSRLTRMAAAAA